MPQLGVHVEGVSADDVEGPGIALQDALQQPGGGGPLPELRWKSGADDKLHEVARLAARANVSDDLVWVSLPTLNEEVRLVSLPAVFRTLSEPNEWKELFR